MVGGVKREQFTLGGVSKAGENFCLPRCPTSSETQRDEALCSPVAADEHIRVVAACKLPAPKRSQIDINIH